MASAKASSDLLDRVSCDVCMELFNSTSHVPKLLPCQHTFCQSCIAQATNGNSFPAAIKCPTCRLQHTVPSEGFTTNRVALDIADELQKESEAAEVLKCEKHVRKEAILVCIQCLHGLCLTCVKTSSRSHRDHDLQELDEAVPILQKILKKKADAKRIILQQNISLLQESPCSYSEMKKAENDIRNIYERISTETLAWSNKQHATVKKLQLTALKREQNLLSELESLEQVESELSNLLQQLRQLEKNDDKSTQGTDSLEMSEVDNSKYSESIRRLQTNVVSILSSRDSLQSTFLCQQLKDQMVDVGQQTQSVINSASGKKQRSIGKIIKIVIDALAYTSLGLVVVALCTDRKH